MEFGINVFDRRFVIEVNFAVLERKTDNQRVDLLGLSRSQETINSVRADPPTIKHIGRFTKHRLSEAKVQNLI